MRRRGRIRRKSKKRPKWENLELREWYLETNPDDELGKHLAGELWERTRCQWMPGDNCCHHIGHVSRQRWDIVTNLITVSPQAHHYVQELAVVPGTVACLYAKMLKGELHREQMREAWGRDPVGWVDIHRGELDEHYDSMAMAILEAF